jgi:aspartate kinase
VSGAATVYKFGGTSLADPDRIRHVAELCRDAPRPLVVVVSALAGVTDALAALAGSGATAADDAGALEEVAARHRGVVDALELPGEVAEGLEERIRRARATLESPPSPPRSDALLALGEDLSALLVAAAVDAAGSPAVAFDARRVVRTDDRFGAAVPRGRAIRAAAARELAPAVEEGTVAVVQGFVGATGDGRTTTLGRGGSDFTAALLGAALDADAVHVWTDVEGVLSGDPRAVGRPFLLEELGFEEAVELSWAGARVLHPVAAKWAVSQGVPVRIRSTFQPDRPGTSIRHDVRGAAAVAAVTAKPGVALLKVRSRPWALPYGFLARVFRVLARHRLEVDLVATSHSSTAFTIDAAEELDAVVEELGRFAEVEARTGLTTVTVVGRGLLREPRENARVFASLEDTPLHLISQASDVCVSLVVDEARADEVVARLHRSLVRGPEGREEIDVGPGRAEAPDARDDAGGPASQRRPA